MCRPEGNCTPFGSNDVDLRRLSSLTRPLRPGGEGAEWELIVGQGAALAVGGGEARAGLGIVPADEEAVRRAGLSERCRVHLMLVVPEVARLPQRGGAVAAAGRRVALGALASRADEVHEDGVIRRKRGLRLPGECQVEPLVRRVAGEIVAAQADGAEVRYERVFGIGLGRR